MQVLSFCLDAPALAVVTDRWQQEPSPFVVRETTQHAQLVSLALALQRSGAPAHLIVHARKQERMSRPVKAVPKGNAATRRLVRIYRAKLFECDVIAIRQGWAARQKYARWDGRTPTRAKYERYIHRKLQASGLRVSLSTVKSVLNQQTWDAV